MYICDLDGDSAHAEAAEVEHMRLARDLEPLDVLEDQRRPALEHLCFRVRG